MARKADAGTKLEVRVAAELYQDMLPLLKDGINVGKSDVPMGLLSLNAAVDLLHGGAYSRPINELPYFANDFNPTTGSASSKWSPPNGIKNLYSQGVGGWLAQITAGNNGSALADEILWDSNVPHVLPKLLSDQAYAMHRLLLAQTATGSLFTTAATGLTTLVEGGATAAQAILGREK